MAKNIWQKAKPILTAALEHDPRRWPAMVAESCGEDFELFFEVSSLLDASRNVGDFIERPALDMLGFRRVDRGWQARKPDRDPDRTRLP